ncbi:MAG: DUF6491 family protein [Pseudomonadota bacterium]
MIQNVTKTGVLLLAFFAVGFTASAGNASKAKDQSAKLEKALKKFNKTGEVDRCLSTHRIRNIRAPDDRHLIIRYSASVSYLSKLPFRCSGLGFHEAIAYKSFGNRICRSDRFRVISSNRFLGAGCGFGSFEKLKRKPKTQ